MECICKKTSAPINLPVRRSNGCYPLPSFLRRRRYKRLRQGIPLQSSRYQPFLNADTFDRYQDEAELIITHSGTGAIIKAVKKGKRVIVVPRLCQYGEHVDDHQVQIAEMFDQLGLVCACKELDELGEKIAQARVMRFNTYRSNTDKIVQSLDDYLQSL